MESSEEARQWNEARIHCSQTAEKVESNWCCPEQQAALMQKITQLYLSQELGKEEKLKGNCALTATKAKAIGPSSCSSVVLSNKLPWCRKLSNYTWAKSSAKRKSWKAIVLWLLRKQKPLGRAVAHLPREWVVLGRAGNYLASWRWKIISKTKTI